MTITKNRDADTLTIALEGRLDTTTAPLLEAEVKQGLDGVKRLEFDFHALEYISSAGLRVLLATQKTMNRQGSMLKSRDLWTSCRLSEKRAEPADPEPPGVRAGSGCVPDEIRSQEQLETKEEGHPAAGRQAGLHAPVAL